MCVFVLLLLLLKGNCVSHVVVKERVIVDTGVQRREERKGDGAYPKEGVEMEKKQIGRAHV